MKNKIKMIKFTLSLLLVYIAVSVSGCMPHSTQSTEVGVRTIKWSPFVKKGVMQKIYAPGTTFFFPPLINDWHTFDTKLRNMEMTIKKGQGAHYGPDDVLFKTIDGNDISLDVIIAYRIIPDKAPYILEYVAKDNLELEEKVVRPISRNITRDLFGELKTEDFYVANKRTEKADKAIALLNEQLSAYGVIVESVLSKDYRFNPAYQKAIEEKKVADQMAERFKSEVNATVEEYKQKLQQSQGEVNQMVAAADGEFAKEKIEADAYYEQESRIAKAIEIEGIAEAKGIEKTVEALNNSGGITMVKLKMAEALIGKPIYLLPFSETSGMDLKTTNVNDLLRTYGVQKAAQKQN
ncbi:MAG: prohibitin family protein [Candidatus Omnitrophica bacterium]|nr:prohibitin family protein [Candidatus Omnitrophota bacterium]